MKTLSIPQTVMEEPDRNLRFQSIRLWFKEQEAKAPTSGESAFSSGCPMLDAFTGGGFEPGTFTEVVEKQPGSGVESILYSIMRSAFRTGKHIALIDAQNTFDPGSYPAHLLNSLLWVRCSRPEQALAASDILLRDDTFPLTLLDLRNIPDKTLRSIRPENWTRLQHACEDAQTSLLVWSSKARVPCARLRVALTETMPIQILDHPWAPESSWQTLQMEVLKRQIFTAAPEEIGVQVSAG